MKQLITSLVLLALLGFAPVAQAQDNRGPGSLNSGPGRVRFDDRDDDRIRPLPLATSTRGNMRAEVKARIDARLASSTARRATSTARKMELREDISKRRADHTGKKLLATIERLEKLADRVESRIEKVEANGGDASTSERFLAEARAHLSEARVALEAYSSVDLSGERLSENFERVRAAAAEVKEHLRLAHRSLVDAIRSLKPGRMTGNRATSTTATTTP